MSEMVVVRSKIKEHAQGCNVSGDFAEALNKEVSGKTIRDMIVGGDNNAIASVEIGKILDDFAYYDVRCDFSGNGIKVIRGGSGKTVSVKFGGKEVSLRC